jgi:hypothetical protein
MEDPIRKIAKNKRPGGMASVVEHLPSKAVQSPYLNTSTAKKKKKIEEEAECPHD